MSPWLSVLPILFSFMCVFQITEIVSNHWSIVKHPLLEHNSPNNKRKEHWKPKRPENSRNGPGCSNIPDHHSLFGRFWEISLDGFELRGPFDLLAFVFIYSGDILVSIESNKHHTTTSWGRPVDWFHTISIGFFRSSPVWGEIDIARCVCHDSSAAETKPIPPKETSGVLLHGVEILAHFLAPETVFGSVFRFLY